MHALLTALVTWLAVNCGLPAIYDHPRVELVPPAKIVALRYRGLASDRQPRAAIAAKQSARPDVGQDLVAVYDDESRTIYLRDDWKGETPAELSVLAHEMVHHLQNAAGLKYECPQAREKPAYLAQDRWLALFGRTLADEFQLDPMTLLLRTRCMG